MTAFYYIANFFAGIFLCNCIPHITCGLRGEPFPTPFAKPHGVGHSSSLLNFLWGFLNFLIGIFLLSFSPILVGFNSGFMLFILGILVIGVYLSCHFEAVRRNQYNQNTGNE